MISTAKLAGVVAVALMSSMTAALAADTSALPKDSRLATASEVSQVAGRIKLPARTKYQGMSADEKLAAAKKLGLIVTRIVKHHSPASGGPADGTIQNVFMSGVNTLWVCCNIDNYGWSADIPANQGFVVVGFVATPGSRYLVDCEISPGPSAESSNFTGQFQIYSWYSTSVSIPSTPTVTNINGIDNQVLQSQTTPGNAGPNGYVEFVAPTLTAPQGATVGVIEFSANAEFVIQGCTVDATE